MNIIEKYDKHFIYAGALVNFFMIINFIILLVNPSVSDANKIYSVTLLIGLEALLAHSGVFMAIWNKKLTLLLFIISYGFFVFFLNTLAEGNFILYSYMVVIFNRMRFAFINANEKTKVLYVSKAVFGAIIYFILMFSFIFSPSIYPEFALNKEFLNKSGYNSLIEKGLISDYPNVSLLFSILYFTAISFLDLFLNKYKESWYRIWKKGKTSNGIDIQIKKRQ